MMQQKKQLFKYFKTAVLALTIIVSSQIGYAGNIQGTLNLSLGSPRGELEQNIDRNAYGVAGTIGVKLGKSPFMLGLDLGLLNYGNDREFDHLQNYSHIGLVLKHSYNIFHGLSLLRFEPFENGSVSPYLDGLLGVGYFWTSTSIEGDEYEEDVVIETDHDDAAMTYGFGGGLKINVGKNRKRRSTGETYFIDLRFRYLFGGQVEYLTKGSIIADGNDVTYLISESRSNLFTFQIGFGIYF